MMSPPSIPGATGEIPSARTRVLVRDFTSLLAQQMFFWGQDVLHPRGNLLCESGFEKRESQGLQGTSCYRKSLDGGGFIELHGACAGFYDPSRQRCHNFLYIRRKERCFLYSGEEPPAPGFYAVDTLHPGPIDDLYLVSLRFLDWWLDYEEWISEEMSVDWRSQNFRAFALLPTSRPKLPPWEAVLWLRQYRRNPLKVPRVRERMRSLKSI